MNIKKITLEVPDETFLIDFVYYYQNGDHVTKATGMYDKTELTDGSILKAWSNEWIQTFKKDEDSAE